MAALDCRRYCPRLSSSVRLPSIRLGASCNETDSAGRLSLQVSRPAETEVRLRSGRTMKIKGRPPKTAATEVLRGVVTLAYALHQTKCSLHRFQRLYVDGRNTRRSGASSTQLAYRWAHGEVTPSDATVRALSAVIPNIHTLYAHPVFYLLQDSKVDFAYSYSLLTCYVRGLGPMDESEGAKGGHRVACFMRLSPESSALDVLDTFAVAVASLRCAEAFDVADYHLKGVPGLYAGVPVVASQPWFAAHWRLFRHCVMRVHRRCRASALVCEPNWTAIRRQTDAIGLHDPALGLNARVFGSNAAGLSELALQRDIRAAKVIDDQSRDATSLLEPKWWQAFATRPRAR